MPDISDFPVYGSLTGIDLLTDTAEVSPGIILRKKYSETFSTPVLRFSKPTEKNPYAGPWAAVIGGTNFKAHTEIEIHHNETLRERSPKQGAWLIAAILRLRMASPVRVAVLSSVSLGQLVDKTSGVHAISFEKSLIHIGEFADEFATLDAVEQKWLACALQNITHLLQIDNFQRAFIIFDQAHWCPTPEASILLVWTSMEVLFDIGTEREKKRAISRAISDYISTDRSQRDRIYGEVSSLYEKRGSIVHAGKTGDVPDIVRTFRVGKTVLQKTILTGALPR